MSSVRRSHAERRMEIRENLLTVAKEMFGERGYNETHIEDIAKACNLTIRPIYHYYESKLGLFGAVIQNIEEDRVQAIENMSDASASDISLNQARRWSGVDLSTLMFLMSRSRNQRV